MARCRELLAKQGSCTAPACKCSPGQDRQSCTFWESNSGSHDKEGGLTKDPEQAQQQGDVTLHMSITPIISVVVEGTGNVGILRATATMFVSAQVDFQIKAQLKAGCDGDPNSIYFRVSLHVDIWVFGSMTFSTDMGGISCPWPGGKPIPGLCERVTFPFGLGSFLFSKGRLCPCEHHGGQWYVRGFKPCCSHNWLTSTLNPVHIFSLDATEPGGISIVPPLIPLNQGGYVCISRNLDLQLSAAGFHYAQNVARDIQASADIMITVAAQSGGALVGIGIEVVDEIAQSTAAAAPGTVPTLVAGAQALMQTVRDGGGAGMITGAVRLCRDGCNRYGQQAPPGGSPGVDIKFTVVPAARRRIRHKIGAAAGALAPHVLLSADPHGRHGLAEGQAGLPSMRATQAEIDHCQAKMVAVTRADDSADLETAGTSLDCSNYPDVKVTQAGFGLVTVIESHCQRGEERVDDPSSPATFTCRPCPGGTHSVLLQPCARCGVGKFSQDGASQCGDCVAGLYGDPETQKCTACPIGKYIANPQATFTDPATDCASCTTGTYAATGFPQCVDCAPGTYADADGASACTSCPAGTSSAVGASRSAGNCASCIPGKFAEAGLSACKECVRGKYVDATGASECTNCPANTFGARTGATSADVCAACLSNTVSEPGAECSCPAGYVASYSAPGTVTRDNMLYADMDVGVDFELEFELTVRSTLPLSGTVVHYNLPRA